MKRIFLCLDGTWNNTYRKGQRDDGMRVVKPTNVLKAARAIEPVDDAGIQQVVYYRTGVGSMSRYPGMSNRLLRRFDKYLGGAWGAGFEGQVEAALTFLVHNYNSGDQVFILGFSRGAATARALTQLIGWMGGVPVKADAFYLPKIYRHYMRSKGRQSVEDVKHIIKSAIDQLNRERSRHIIDHPFASWHQLQIDFLGVWDSVLALGSRFWHRQDRQFYLHNAPASCVDHARQALAIDECRHDFLPAIWRHRSREEQTLKQHWFAGSHANVGGGYVRDGLANVTLHWMLQELCHLFPQVALNHGYLKHYKAFAYDELVDSYQWAYQLKDRLTSRSGRRNIYTSQDPEYKDSGLFIDDSVFTRMNSEPGKIVSDLSGYRPANLLAYLQSRNQA